MRKKRLVRNKGKRILFFLFGFVGLVLILGVGLVTFKLIWKIDFDFYSFGMRPKVLGSYVTHTSLSDFQKELDRASIKYKSIDFDIKGDGIEVVLDSDIKVLFSESVSASYQVSSLQQLLLRLTINKVETVTGVEKQDMNGKKPSVIDFRYNKPIVRF